jgi:hypothetical protein
MAHVERLTTEDRQVTQHPYRYVHVLLGRYGAAEPVLEMRRANARVIARSEALIIQLCAELECVDVCDDLPSVSACSRIV